MIRKLLTALFCIAICAESGAAGTQAITINSSTGQVQQAGPINLGTISLKMQPAGSGATSRDVAAQIKDIAVNVKTWGAVGDGTTDDSSAIQSAISLGMSVYFPPGTYRIATKLQTSAAIGGGQVYSGAGAWLTRILPDSGVDGFWVLGKGQTIRDMAIIGTGTNAKGIVLGGTGGGYSNEFFGRSLRVQYFDIGVSNENGWDGCGVEDCSIAFCNTGIYAAGNQDYFGVKRCDVTHGVTFNNGDVGTTASSTTVTCADTTGVIDGRYVTGNGIPAGTTIVSHVTNTSLTLSQAATQTIAHNSLSQVYGVGAQTDGTGKMTIDGGVWAGLATPFKLTNGGRLSVAHTHAELSDGLGIIKAASNAVVDAHDNYMADPPNTGYLHGSFATGTRGVFVHNTSSAPDFIVAYSGTCDIRSPDFSCVVYYNGDHYFRAGPWLTVNQGDTAGTGFWPAAAEKVLGMQVNQVADHALGTREIKWECLRTASNTFSWQKINGTATALDSDTDGTLAANSDSRAATQKAVKTYVDAHGGIGASYSASCSGAVNIPGSYATCTGLSITGVKAGTYQVIFKGSVYANPEGWAWKVVASAGSITSVGYYQRFCTWGTPTFDGSLTAFATGEDTVSGFLATQMPFDYGATITLSADADITIQHKTHSGTPDGQVMAGTRFILIKQ